MSAPASFFGQDTDLERIKDLIEPGNVDYQSCESDLLQFRRTNPRRIAFDNYVYCTKSGGNLRRVTTTPSGYLGRY
jgi:hypothetical protein